MAIAITAKISIDGGPALADYHSISIRQELFSHHSFQVAVPYEMLEQERTDGFFHQAHQRYCGKPITITLTPTVMTSYPALIFKGVITHIALSNSGDFAHSFVLSGFSPTYLLEDGSQRRTFLKKGLKSIFDEVLKPYPQNLVKVAAIKPQHRDPVKYTVQYGESNYVFLRRLADAYGEWFYYDGQAIRLGKPEDGQPLPFTVIGTEGFSMAMELLPAKFTMNRYDYLAHQPYEGTSGSQSLNQLNPFAAAALQQSEQLFAQPARFIANRHVRSQGQLNTTIKEWKANQVSGMVTFQGNGENPGFGVGKLMVVQGGTEKARHDYGTYRLTEVTHSVQADQYQNTFVALPDAAEHPAPNPEAHPPLGVSELAEVLDVADPQNLGRIRVRYYWSVDKPTDAETGWVRVSTPYSGDGKGQLFTPEVGSQVLVGYEHGLAEFPVVLGNLFHPQNPQSAKYTTPNNQLKGLQTAGGNKFVMVDTKGAQTILLSNSNNKDTSILVSFKGDGSVDIKTNGPINLTAGGNITLEAAKNIELRAGGDISLAAQKNVSVHATEENVAIRAQKELLLTAVSDDLTLEAASKKFVAKAADNVEIRAAGIAKINGQDLKLNQPG
ncbi:type VI secretion system Vgr family protein [Hymenobacter terrenus]|uniref:type VI secretion system Vgr family protein n=1 Tax=Hymenobacter terrenus TaxID=1629124 RepID=UPI0006983171|nr:phage baseplate assembly protein V [Hymenobacter terrenus]